MIARRREASLAGPVGLSVLLHVAAAAAFLLARAPTAPPLPPMYRVELVAAPPGPRAIGVVSDAPAPAEPAKAPPRAEKRIAEPAVAIKKAAPVKGAKKATPITTPTSKRVPDAAAPRAGGGPTGGRGADVATVRTEGTEFPFPGYLQNIVRQIALNFRPSNPNAPLRAEVFFLIRRDGTLAGPPRFVVRSGNYSFDLECLGAIEATVQARAFGALPAGFADDVLPVTFAFDPRVLR
ncbi:MAG: TonB C-terminal domain-containing protein [Gemmatimonadaceae bacterium]|nr:TonB C-terminal domain-containing protein [Gemmatimonadaceae bacterium]